MKEVILGMMGLEMLNISTVAEWVFLKRLEIKQILLLKI